MPMSPLDMARQLNMLGVQNVGDVIRGPWGNQPVEQGVPIVPGTGQPGGMSPPPPSATWAKNLEPYQQRGAGLSEKDILKNALLKEAEGKLARNPNDVEAEHFARAMRGEFDGPAGQQRLREFNERTKGLAVPNTPAEQRGTELSRPMKEEPMWTKWGQGAGVPVDRLLKAVPALRQSWNLSDNEIKYYFTLMKQRGEL